MRISDWSSDVCSSDLLVAGRRAFAPAPGLLACGPFVSSSSQRAMTDPAPEASAIAASLAAIHARIAEATATVPRDPARVTLVAVAPAFPAEAVAAPQIVRAACRVRACQYVSISMVAVSL